MLREVPTLSKRGQLAFVAWNDLAGERQVGQCMGPIRWTAIASWCDRYAVPDAEHLIELVQAIDAEWLKDDASTRARPQADTKHAQGSERR